MQDPRKPRPLKLRSVSALVVDANSFSRGLIGDILRTLDVTNVSSARDADAAFADLTERKIDVLLVSGEEADPSKALDFVRELRRMLDQRIRRLPAILVTSGLTRETVINGRDAGVDEFLAKPISPAALQQRLQMVIETPRPFVDCSVFLGPCRRRKNPADYYGAKRRAGERTAERPAMIDQDEVARETPIRRALSRLRELCAALSASRPETLGAALEDLKTAKSIAAEQKDHALHAGLASFESYIAIATPLGQVDPLVIDTALAALEQLAALPSNYAEARDSVAIALGKAIQKKLAA